MAKSNFEIELRSIAKAFGACVANELVNLSVKKGSIHAIVGENGAGKSTAMKILFGQFIPDSGEIFLRGEAKCWRSPADAIAAGIGMVHQHFMLAGNHTAVENILLASKSFSLAPLDRQTARTRLEKLLGDFHMEVELDSPVEDLPVGMQQRIEILKLLYQNSEILILDEPTAVLAPGEIASLFRTLKQMAAEGKTILIVTHKLKEVMNVADRVTVFRAGRVVAEREIAGTSVGEIASLMIGRELAKVESLRKETGTDFVLELKGARPRDKHSRLKEISFRLRAGEILGVAGVEGNGQTELIRLLRDPAREMGSGELSLLGKRAEKFNGSRMRAEAVGFFPEDRLAEGLLLDSPLTENFFLGKSRRPEFRRAGLLNRGAVAAATQAAIREYDVRPADVGAIVRGLSGGNQQKLVVARELGDRPRFLLAAQPTRGVDIGAIEFIHGKLLDLRNSGAGVLLISSELDEVLKLSDRLLVLYRGEVVGSFLKGDFNENRIGLLMAGGARE
ncbi:MAG: ABC transporter ATP-binding protein [Bacteriovoracia bacterium]